MTVRSYDLFIGGGGRGGARGARLQKPLCGGPRGKPPRPAARRAGQARPGSPPACPRGRVSPTPPLISPPTLAPQKAAPARPCGCPGVVNPAPEPPPPAMMLAEIAAEAGAPRG